MRLRNIFTVLLIATTLVGCGGTGTPSFKENIVKIRSINASEAKVEPVSVKARNRKEANDIETEDNYIIITKDVTDVQFTITLDNPEAYGIDALRVFCDDPEAQIQVEGEWKPISQEANGTRIVNWSSEDPYEKTYNIRTTSLEDLYTFKVVDIRLAGHDTFLSKQTNSTDFGNNELDIYKMDTDAYELDVISNTFEEIKFGIKVKEGITNLSNFKVDGKEPNEEGYWVMNESKEDCRISYDFEVENGMKVRRENERWVGPTNIKIGMYGSFYIQKWTYDYSINYYNFPIYIFSIETPVVTINWKGTITEIPAIMVNNEVMLCVPTNIFGDDFKEPYDYDGLSYRYDQYAQQWVNDVGVFNIDMEFLNVKVTYQFIARYSSEQVGWYCDIKELEA